MGSASQAQARGSDTPNAVFDLGTTAGGEAKAGQHSRPLESMGSHALCEFQGGERCYQRSFGRRFSRRWEDVTTATQGEPAPSTATDCLPGPTARSFVRNAEGNWFRTHVAARG